MDNVENISNIMQNAGFDVEPITCDISSRTSTKSFIEEVEKYGEISALINAARVSPSQASKETILKVDLYGTAILLEEVGKVIKKVE